jgi:hypothetical protein
LRSGIRGQEILKRIELNTTDRHQGRLTEQSLQAGLQGLREEGIVCLRGAANVVDVLALNDKMQADLDVRAPTRTANAWNGLRPPPFDPFLFTSIVYNEFAIDLCRGLLGANATLTTYGANTSWPGQGEAQPVHRDVADGPITNKCPALVLNLPLTKFTIENGATLIYPRSHLSSVAQGAGSRKYTAEMLLAQQGSYPAEQTTDIEPGDIVVRDLRLWHGGMPNHSSERRIMLALVVIDPDYQAQDETGFKGFDAEQGSEAFWSHPRLRTSVMFVPPGDRSYYMHGHHSTPPTSLRLDWLERTQ